MTGNIGTDRRRRERSRRLRRWTLLAVVAAMALHIAFWGRPVPRRYAVWHTASGTPVEWVRARRASPPESWRARDTDGDGVLDEFETPAGSFARPGLRAEPKRWLVICLDGVPLGTMRNLWDSGHFREFHRPSATISTLPSDSEAAITGALHAAPGPGYEHRYFDRARNQIRGGMWVTLTGAGIPYIQALDYDAPGWAKGLVYIVSYKSYRADLGRLRNAFLASQQKVFLAHLATSDSLFHIYRTAETDPLLVEFESLLRDLYLDAQGELGVLVFSDHGSTLAPGHAVPLEEFLKHRGWRLRKTLKCPRDVAVPDYGLVGFFAVYCRREAAANLAEELAALEGADLVVYPDASARGATILSGRGRAHLGWSADGTRFSYAAEPAAAGDPLEFTPVFDRLRAAGRLTDDGTASDADLFAATSTARYPDAAARIRDWATNHVQNRADILASLKPGYFHGSGFFQHIVDITGTHGALDAPSSLGFAMATRPLPPTVRLADLLPGEFLARDKSTQMNEHRWRGRTEWNAVCQSVHSYQCLSVFIWGSD